MAPVFFLYSAFSVKNGSLQSIHIATIINLICIKCQFDILGDGVVLLYSYPTKDKKRLIPKTVIHGTTNLGVEKIKEHGILSRGFTLLGMRKKPSSLDFGEGFYCTYQNEICYKQAHLLSITRASRFPGAEPRVIAIHVRPDINQDQFLKCVYFDGNKDGDGLKWAHFVAHHRVHKDKSKCVNDICNGHPDIMIGPVADGKAISAYAHDVYQGRMSLEDFYDEITQAEWFPDYKQIVFGEGAIKYLEPVL